MARKKNLLLKNVKIVDIAVQGKGVGKTDDGQVVFIKNVVPGDVVDVQVHKKKKNFYEGVVSYTHFLSKDRVTPKCSYFGICGGCSWQSLSYQKQVFYKQQEIVQNFKRISKIEVEEFLPIIPVKNQYFYRNKLEYSFSNNKWLTKEEISSKKEIKNKNALGFHISGRYDKVLDIEQCHLQEDPSNQVKNKLRNYALDNNISFFDLRKNKGDLRTLMIRSNLKGELLVFLQFGNYKCVKLILNYLKKEFSAIKSLQYAINKKRNDSIYDLDVKIYSGANYIIEKIGGLKFKIGVKTFFQTNSRQAEKLYKEINKIANVSNKDIVYDLYTGTGTIAQFISKGAKRVIGIESVSDSVALAKENCEINNINNCDFFVGEIRNVITDDFIQKNGRANVLITDPPRNGMHPDVLKAIFKIAPKKIVYVSCNSSTQARDLLILNERYKITKSQAVDMFPQTHHIENVVLLELK